MTERAAIRLILIGMGEAHRSPKGLDGVWRNLAAGTRRDGAMRRVDRTGCGQK